MEWRTSCPYTRKTWRYYCPLRWNFWGIGGLYLSEGRGGGMMIGLRERWNCQLHVRYQQFSPSFLSHRGTCALHEYVHYWNIHPYTGITSQSFNIQTSFCALLTSFELPYARVFVFGWEVVLYACTKRADSSFGLTLVFISVNPLVMLPPINYKFEFVSPTALINIKTKIYVL